MYLAQGLGGLNEGEKVVVEGQNNLAEGVRVKIID